MDARMSSEAASREPLSDVDREMLVLCSNNSMRLCSVEYHCYIRV